MLPMELSCPLCHPDFVKDPPATIALRSATCPTCGLWWVEPGSDRAVYAGASDERPVSLRLALRPAIGLGSGVLGSVLLAVGCLGYGAALTSIATVVENPSDFFAWMGLLVGVPLGASVGTLCLAIILQGILHVLVPARLEGSESLLRVKVWQTWSNLGSGFRRTDVTVPRNQIQGVAFLTGQGGESQLFLLHSSGLMFGTGWSGTKLDATRRSEPLLAWLATQR